MIDNTDFLDIISGILHANYAKITIDRFAYTSMKTRKRLYDI